MAAMMGTPRRRGTPRRPTGWRGPARSGECAGEARRRCSMLAAMARSLFGTDGVRGLAGEKLTADLALALGRAATNLSPARAPRVLIIRDPRESGETLAAALAAGVAAAGGEAAGGRAGGAGGGVAAGARGAPAGAAAGRGGRRPPPGVGCPLGPPPFSTTTAS